MRRCQPRCTAAEGAVAETLVAKEGVRGRWHDDVTVEGYRQSGRVNGVFDGAAPRSLRDYCAGSGKRRGRRAG
jgi:hypothetical protein